MWNFLEKDLTSPDLDRALYCLYRLIQEKAIEISEEQKNKAYLYSKHRGRWTWSEFLPKVKILMDNINAKH